MSSMQFLRELAALVSCKEDHNLTDIYDRIYRECVNKGDDVVAALSVAFFAILYKKDRVLAELLMNPLASAFDILLFSASVTENFTKLNESKYETAAFKEMPLMSYNLFTGHTVPPHWQKDWTPWEQDPFYDDVILLRMYSVLCKHGVWEVVRKGLQREDARLIESFDKRLSPPGVPNACPVDADALKVGSAQSVGGVQTA